MVYGVEIAQTSGDMSADIGSDNTYFGCAGTTRCGTVVSNLQEVRARVGRTYGQILFYVTAGAARADVEANIGLSNEVLGSGSVNGYSLGAGMEYALSARLSIMAEYSHVTLNRMEIPEGCETCSVMPDFGSLRLGVSLRF